MRPSDEQLYCLMDYDLAQCGRHILVKLDGDDGIPRAVGSFANGAWQEIRYTNNVLARAASAPTPPRC